MHSFEDTAQFQIACSSVWGFAVNLSQVENLDCHRFSSYHGHVVRSDLDMNMINTYMSTNIYQQFQSYDFCLIGCILALVWTIHRNRMTLPHRNWTHYQCPAKKDGARLIWLWIRSKFWYLIEILVELYWILSKSNDFILIMTIYYNSHDPWYPCA